MKSVNFTPMIIGVFAGIVHVNATSHVVNRNLFTNSDGSCNMIFCRTNNVESAGFCQNGHQKFLDRNCTARYFGQAWSVRNP